MDLWDRSGRTKRAYRLRGNFSDALDAVESGEDGIKVGVNIEVSLRTLLPSSITAFSVERTSKDES
jgi:hypothetical protein